MLELCPKVGDGDLGNHGVLEVVAMTVVAWIGPVARLGFIEEEKKSDFAG